MGRGTYEFRSERRAEDACISLFVSVSKKGEEWKELGPTRNELSVVFEGFATIGWLRETALGDARSQPFSLTPSTEVQSHGSQVPGPESKP